MRFATLISLTSLATASAVCGWVFIERDPERLAALTERLAAVKDNLQVTPAGPSKVIYLNREGVTLTSGRDDASENRSSLVDAGETASIPAFSGSDRSWRRLKKCVEKKFVDFDVQVVDRRPVSGDYVMVAVGGRPKDLGLEDGAFENAAGLAPFNGRPIPGAVVLVFARTVGNAVTAMCETAAHEIGHAYGLDHARHCSDLMTYMPRCGARVFLDRNVSCGEHTSRECKTPRGVQAHDHVHEHMHDHAPEAPKQNSYAHMMKVLGPRV